MFANGGQQPSQMVGDMDHFGKVWYIPDSLADIIPITLVNKSVRITIDSNVNTTQFIHMNDESIIKFKGYGSRLYYYDTLIYEYS